MKSTSWDCAWARELKRVREYCLSLIVLQQVSMVVNVLICPSDFSKQLPVYLLKSLGHPFLLRSDKSNVSLR